MQLLGLIVSVIMLAGGLFMAISANSGMLKIKDAQRNYPNRVHFNGEIEYTGDPTDVEESLSVSLFYGSVLAIIGICGIAYFY